MIIQLDSNSKLGPELIPGDLPPQSPNGKILASLIYRNYLTIGNSMNCCQGLITRVRKTKVSEENSVIDFIFLSEELSHEVTSVVIDEQREHVLTKMINTKNGVKGWKWSQCNNY